MGRERTGSVGMVAHGGGAVVHGECGDGCARMGRPTHEVNAGPHAGLAMDTGPRRGAGIGYRPHIEEEGALGRTNARTYALLWNLFD